MAAKHRVGVWAVLLGLALALGVPATAESGPFLGDWGWCWHQDPTCPRGEYPFLHYWTYWLYRVRANCHPSNLDQYPPGPCGVPPAQYIYIPYPCRSAPPAPTVPYADPAGYYGRPTGLPFALP